MTAMAIRRAFSSNLGKWRKRMTIRSAFSSNLGKWRKRKEGCVKPT